MPIVRVHRAKQLADRLRAYEIFVDGESKGAVRAGGAVDFRVENGRHRIVLRLDWCASNAIEFSLWDDETAEFDCGNNTGGFWSVFYVLFRPHDYLWIKKR